MTPKMTAMKDSVLNQSKNFAQNNRVGQSIQRTFTPIIKSHTPKDSMVKSEGKHVSNENKSLDKTLPRYGKVKISSQLRKRLRSRTPNVELNRKVNEGVKLSMIDFALLGKMINNKLEADHIVSMNKIIKMDGFDKLDYKQQIDLLNYEKYNEIK